MHPLPSAIDVQSKAFLDNQAKNQALVDKLKDKLQKAEEGGGERYVTRHLSRGKLLARQRVDLLLDQDSPFLEICPLAGCHEGGVVPGGSVVVGIGQVEGRWCMINASDPTVQGGAINQWGMKRSQRAGQIARENHLPEIHLIESAGGDLPNQADIFVPGGAGFRHITQRSQHKLPTLSLVFGSCTAGGAYIPGMSDYTIMVKEAGYMYLAGPPLVKMATGEQVDDESLGGAHMHAKTSGVSDYLAENEADAIRLGREIVSRYPNQPAWLPSGPADPPLYPADELSGIASNDLKIPFDCREVIARIVDGSRFHEFKGQYGSTLVCGFAEIAGYRVGILGNNGILFSDSANKGAQFIALCNQQDTPLLFLQNITGFMVGRAAEEAGIIKAGSKLINAVSNSTVPAITLMVGGSYGAGNYAMMGRSYQPRFLFSWPNHKIAVMGPEQLAGVIDLVKRQAAARKGKPVNEEQLTMMKTMLAGKVEHESSCWSSTGRLWDDGVIDPRDTRTILAMALTVIAHAPVEGTTSWGTFRH